MRLSDAARQYITAKRTSGCIFEDGESRFTNFERFVGDIELYKLTTHQVGEYLNRKPVANSTWLATYFLLLRFFEFWSSRNEMPELVMPSLRRRTASTFAPHLYTQSELRVLLKAAVPRQREFVIHDRTLRTLLIFLYATGSRLGEVLALKCADLNFRNNRLTFRGEAFVRSRTIPLNPDLSKILQSYLRWRTRAGVGGDRLFVNRTGEPLVDTTVREFFIRLCIHAGVYRRDGTHRPPRLCDLRNSFAVHRITAWLKSGTNLSRMLPALAAYMGHLCLESTERYFFMTPDRYRKELCKLMPSRGQQHWRNDPALMSFLNSL
jgi:integrase/recombinase XerD